jgi:hypothetical protein
MKSGNWIYDIETLKNCFILCATNGKETHIFKIYKHGNIVINDYNKMKQFLLNTDGLIGFNNIGFDYPVIHKLLTIKFPTIDNLIRIQYDTAQTIIKEQDYDYKDRTVNVTERDWLIPQLDLFRIWHFNNKAKATGLKWLQFSMNWHNIEEMPIDYREDILPEQIDSIVSYCINDIESTKEFFNYTIGNTTHPLYKGIDKIQLRKDIENEFGLNCANWNDVKIGEQLLKKDYCNLTGIYSKDLDKIKTNIHPEFIWQDCFPDYINFSTPEFNKFINSIKYKYVTEGQEYNFTYKNTTYTIALGGLHSNDKARILEPTSNQILRDCDVGSMYPNRIRKAGLHPLHLSVIWNTNYQKYIEKRLEAKSAYKKTKEMKYQAIQETFKLALNGGSFGKTGETTSWQYCNFTNKKITIGSQMDLLMLIEQLEVAGIEVYSANT